METINLNIFNKILNIRAEVQNELDDVYHTFSYFLSDVNVDKADINIIIEKNNENEYRIVYDDKISACAKVNLYPKLCDIIKRTIILKTSLFCFHAAAVEKNGKAFIFVSTGNSGKSTLCTSLILNDYKLLSDDTCWLDIDTGIIHPYPLAIGTRYKTLDVLPALRDIVIQTTFPGKLIIPILNDWVASPCKEFVYFLWDLDLKSSKFNIETVENDELAYNLLAHSFSFKYCNKKKEAFEKLIYTINKSKCYSLKGHNLSLLPQLLKELS
ncbi:MAG: hypothetical protein LBM93_14510 [Oscillospiraceae bacterium]|jgi:hypothetical protein|nr:hypothetical protein [Oscillospiraceae bacterium]